MPDEETMDWVTAVMRYLPTTMHSPETVQVDGRNGVTLDTFTEFLHLSQDRVRKKLDLHSIDAPDFTDPNLSNVLESVVCQLTAAYVLRKFPAYQEHYKDYFANGFSALDDYILDQLKLKGVGGAPEFVDDDSTPNEYAFPTNW